MCPPLCPCVRCADPEHDSGAVSSSHTGGVTPRKSPIALSRPTPSPLYFSSCPVPRTFTCLFAHVLTPLTLALQASCCLSSPYTWIVGSQSTPPPPYHVPSVNCVTHPPTPRRLVPQVLLPGVHRFLFAFSLPSDLAPTATIPSHIGYSPNGNGQSSHGQFSLSYVLGENVLVCDCGVWCALCWCVACRFGGDGGGEALPPQRVPFSAGGGAVVRQRGPLLPYTPAPPPSPLPCVLQVHLQGLH